MSEVKGRTASFLGEESFTLKMEAIFYYETFYPEGGGSMLIRNVGNHQQDEMA